MPTTARLKFDKNCRDILQLMKIHRTLGGHAPGRRVGLEVLNKSAIVLISAFWEAYCEDVVEEAISMLVAKGNHQALPADLKKQVARELKNEKHELAIWQIAGKGWREYLGKRTTALAEERNRKLNTPKSAQIDAFFLESLGIQTISQYWRWPRMTSERARGKLDEFVELRGSIAHRGSSTKSVTMDIVISFLKHARRLVSKTGGKVIDLVRLITKDRNWGDTGQHRQLSVERTLPPQLAPGAPKH